MARKLMTLALCAGALAAPATGLADNPGTDGGPAQRGCTPVDGGSIYVGATRVSCAVARKVVVKARNGARLKAWSCGRAEDSGFGHCHGRKSRSGAKVHWAVND